jgi:hypothetical protein
MSVHGGRTDSPDRKAPEDETESEEKRFFDSMDDLF